MVDEGPRYIRVRDASGHREKVFFAAVDGTGVGLYRKRGRSRELVMVFPGLQVGVARGQMRDAVLEARPWPETDPDGRR